MPLVEKISLKNEPNKAELKRIRVAAYARVSTDHEEQDGSYDMQIEYFKNKILSNPDYELVKIYADKGVSGTCTNQRIEFKKMIESAKEGNIDLILTKSISRFARNTITTLETIRELKERNVAVEFEKEGIRTDTTNGELMLTILSALAEEESKSISLNIQWGIKAKFKEGKDVHNFYRFLGYEKGWVINEKEAETIRIIYDLYLKNYSMSDISKYLEENHYLRQDKQTKWHPGSIDYILNNPVYCGDIILQKTITLDYRGRIRKKNEGEEPMYYVYDHHPAIISKDKYEKVQLSLKRRKRRNKYNLSISPFFKTVFEDNNEHNPYKRITAHSNSVYKNHYFKPDNKNYPTLKEDLLYETVIVVIKRLIENYLSISDKLNKDIINLNSDYLIIKDNRSIIFNNLKDMLNDIALEKDKDKRELKIINYNKSLKEYEDLGDKEYDLNLKINGISILLKQLPLLKNKEITKEIIKDLYEVLDINMYISNDHIKVNINSVIEEIISLVKVNKTYKLK